MSTSAVVLPVILAGGSGTRLWPLSRESFPKQLLRLEGHNTLLQETALRLSDFGFAGVQVEEPLIVCNEEYRFLVADQLQEVGCGGSRLILEPASRNTAPALTLAALAASMGQERPCVLVMMPADHLIRGLDEFYRALEVAVTLALENRIVTMGIKPDSPQTGLGYIEAGEQLAGFDGAFEISSFREKPDEITATQYLQSGRYLWNSGIFVTRADLWLSLVDALASDVSQICREAWSDVRTDGVFFRVPESVFSRCRSESIDYAVMERLGEFDTAGAGHSGATVALNAQWSDIGSWPALLDVNEQDENGNATQGDVYTYDTHNSLVLADHRLVATVGVEDMIVVETADAVLISRKQSSQDVKQIVSWLKDNSRDEGTTHRCVHRPWGTFEQVDSGERFQVKRLTVKPGASLSLQMHYHRAEHWVVVRGTARVTRDGEVFMLSENESTYIPLGTKHRLENPGKVTLEVIEVQSGSYLGEDDIVRFDDVYDRSSAE